MKKNNDKLKNIICYVLVFSYLYFSHDTLLFGTNIAEQFILVRKVVPFLTLLLILLIFHRDLVFTYKNIFFLALLLFLPIVSCLVNAEEYPNYLYRFIIILNAGLLALLDKKYDVADKFIKVMVFLTTWSLITFVLFNVSPSFVSMLPRFVNTSNNYFATTIFSSTPINQNVLYGFSRNHGIFREPGVFMIFLIASLLFEFKKTGKPKHSRIVIFILGLLSTGSSAGLISLVLVLVYLILFKLELKHKMILSMVVLVTGIFAYRYFGESAVAAKLTYGSNSYGSFYTRFMSLTKNLKIAFENPLFGYGRYRLYGTQLAADRIYSATDNTNTLLIGFAAYGLLFGFVTLIGLLKYSAINEKNIFSAVLIFLILFLTFSNEDMGQNVIYYYIVFIGLYSKWRINKTQTSYRYKNKYNET
ncbi:MAG TPA: hypothetical protein GX010_03655 [Erysipelotrichaceae bacterium]|nr:hypothetical protein [Erysipelotrichaceae bacterium]